MSSELWKKAADARVAVFLKRAELMDKTEGVDRCRSNERALEAQFVDMAAGGDGSIRGSYPGAAHPYMGREACRHYYPGYPDYYFQQVCRGMAWGDVW